MSEEIINSVKTDRLFRHLNEKRLRNQEGMIENSLLASKLGILIAVKTDKYVNFRKEFVDLTERQLATLPSILSEYFNTVFTSVEMKSMVVGTSSIGLKTSEDTFRGIAQSTPKEQKSTGIFRRLKGFFSRK
jgi:hypothetical protein